jgi:EAL domain-containing protein (putative c-di-GMP-specific phosphodiesterase class I)
MKLSVVAEGVETAEQVRLLGLTRCELFQGYFLSRPASPARIRELLDTHAARGGNAPAATAVARAG